MTRDVLIPRPETELLVMAVLDAAKEVLVRQSSPSIADVGTGSGIVAICTAKNLTTSQVKAIDISAEALAVAKTNAETHNVSDRIDFVESDLLSTIEDQSFDIIVSNPPYISQPEMAELRSEVSDYEPHLALCGGQTGTELIQRLVPQAAERLATNGVLLLEVSPMIEIQTHQIIRDHGAFDEPRTLKDLAGLARVIVAKRSAA